MEPWMPLLVAVAAILLILALFYLLWINGHMLFNRKRAGLFTASFPEKNRCQATFSACSGYVKKVIKFGQKRRYAFCFSGQISKGCASVCVENQHKETLLHLTPDQPTGWLDVQAKNRYILVLKFEKAAGKLQIEWR